MSMLKDKLSKYLNFNDGFFIECGSNDGVAQSNTLFLERELNWRGILIEPSLISFKSCLQNRKSENIFLNCALVGSAHTNTTISGDFNGSLMSSIQGQRLNKSPDVEVSARTLSSILDEYRIKKINFFSLDVEGFEYFVLTGIDFSVHRPQYILIEIYDIDYDKIFFHMSNNNYKLIDNLSNFNIHDNPNWDGTHNDFLFVDNSI